MRLITGIRPRLLAFNLLLVFLPLFGFLYLDVYEHQLLRAQERSMVQQARLLAHRLRERLRAHLTGRGLEPGSVEISILVIEPTTS